MAKKRKTNPPPKDETKEQKFIRVVTPRVAKAVKCIKLIGNCAGIGYDYTTAQVDQINEVLDAAVTHVGNKFIKAEADSSEFSFEQPE